MKKGQLDLNMILVVGILLLVGFFVYQSMKSPINPGQVTCPAGQIYFPDAHGCITYANYCLTLGKIYNPNAPIGTDPCISQQYSGEGQGCGGLGIGGKTCIAPLICMLDIRSDLNWGTCRNPNATPTPTSNPDITGQSCVTELGNPGRYVWNGYTYYCVATGGNYNGQPCGGGGAYECGGSAQGFYCERNLFVLIPKGFWTPTCLYK